MNKEQLKAENDRLAGIIKQLRSEMKDLENLVGSLTEDSLCGTFWVICRKCGDKADIDIHHYPEGCIEEFICTNPQCNNKFSL